STAPRSMRWWPPRYPGNGGRPCLAESLLGSIGRRCSSRLSGRHAGARDTHSRWWLRDPKYVVLRHFIEAGDFAAIALTVRVGAVFVAKGQGIVTAHASDIPAFDQIPGLACIHPGRVREAAVFVNLRHVLHIGGDDGLRLFWQVGVGEHFPYNGKPNRRVAVAQYYLPLGPFMLKQKHAAIVADGVFRDSRDGRWGR